MFFLWILEKNDHTYVYPKIKSSLLSLERLFSKDLGSQAPWQIKKCDIINLYQHAYNRHSIPPGEGEGVEVIHLKRLNTHFKVSILCPDKIIKKKPSGDREGATLHSYGVQEGYSLIHGKARCKLSKIEKNGSRCHPKLKISGITL